MLYYITWLILIVYIINFIYNLGSAIVNEKRIVLKEEDPLEKYVSSILAFLYAIWVLSLMQYIDWI